MKPPLATKKLTTLSLLSAIAMALYAVESALPPIVPIPGIKLGLANIITLVVLWKYSAKDAFFVLLVRILLATLFFGQVISLLYSLPKRMPVLFPPAPEVHSPAGHLLPPRYQCPTVG